MWDKKFAGLPLFVIAIVAVVLVGAGLVLLWPTSDHAQARRSTTRSVSAMPSFAPAGSLVELTPEAYIKAGVGTITVSTQPISQDFQAVGTIRIPDGAERVISARAKGRIDHLYVATTGATVREGEPLYEFYSPEILSAEKEYVVALSSQRTSAMSLMTPSQVSVADAVMQRLLLLGITSDQIHALAVSGKVGSTVTVRATRSGTILELLAREGAYVDEGMPIVRLADLSTVWASIQVPDSYIRLIKPRTPVTIQSDSYPGIDFTGAVGFISPIEDGASRTVEVRADFRNVDHHLRPGMTFTADFKLSLGSQLALPVDAVIRTGHGDFVWVQTAPRTFQSTPVTLGVRSDGWYQVLDGVKSGDEVASRAAFLIDAEHQFSTNNPMATMNMSNGDMGAKHAGEGQGTVRSIDEAKLTITLDHGNIPGVMPAMTMPYKAASSDLVKKVHVGDRVKFVLSKQDNGEYWITSIEKE